MDNKIKSVNLSDIDFIFAEQANTKWCWAASIQNILKYHRIEKPQNQIVANTLGQIENWFSPNQGVTNEQLAGILNTLNILNFNDNYNVIPFYYTKIQDNIIINEIKNNRPILYVFKNIGSEHAVVIVGAEYHIEQSDTIIDKLYFFDPWPGNGHKDLSITEIQLYTVGYWTIRIEKD